MGVTLIITFGALLIGIMIGLVIAVIKVSHEYTGKQKFLNKLCNIYLTVIRGTPMIVQLMIMWFVICASLPISKVEAAVIAFGINSGAYVAEILRSGIISIDKGQMEAGRSLGFSYVKTMIYIILPQAFKNALPALGNEVIALLKETAIVGYIALQDITKGMDIIRSNTYDAFMTLIPLALIYLCMVMFLTWVQGKLERRMRQSDIR
jgi:His/Glu/Gln/Arg/opine family amino acid ABC transporter permease subunit